MKKHLCKIIISAMVVLILTLVLIFPSTGISAQEDTKSAAAEISETAVKAGSAKQRRGRAVGSDNSKIPPRFGNKEEFKKELRGRGLSDEQITGNLRLRDGEQDQQGSRRRLRDPSGDNCDSANCPYDGNPPADGVPGRNRNQASADDTAPARGNRGKNAQNKANTPGRSNKSDRRANCPLGQN